VELNQKGFGKHKWEKTFKATKAPPKKKANGDLSKVKCVNYNQLENLQRIAQS
jgi:hypothetical protein